MEQLNSFIANNLLLVGGILVAFLFRDKIKTFLQSKPAPKAYSAADAEFLDQLDLQAKEITEPKWKRMLALWPDIWLLPVLIILGGLLNYMLLQIWPDAIFLGPEQIQKVLYKTVAVFFAYFLFFIHDRLNFKEASTWYASITRQSEYKKLTPWQKRLMYVLRLSVFVLVFALV